MVKRDSSRSFVTADYELYIVAFMGKNDKFLMEKLTTFFQVPHN
jgi:hypothetical protein